MLREQIDLLAGVDEASDRKHGVLFADVGIEKDGIASGINHCLAARAGVGGAKRVEHPGRRCDQSISGRDPADNSVAIPLQPARGPRRATLHRLRPTDEVAVRHDYARQVHRQIAVAKLVEVQHVGPYFANQAGRNCDDSAIVFGASCIHSRRNAVGR